MPVEVNIREAKAHLSELLRRVMSGEEVVIARTGKPIARLTPYQETPARRTPGNDAGKVHIAPDFDEPLPEFEEL